MSGDPDEKYGRGIGFVFAILYGIPLLWLWSATDFPDKFKQVPASSWLLENWYYSYLLLKAHSPLDFVTFFYMWAPLALPIIWTAVYIVRRQRDRASRLAESITAIIATLAIIAGYGYLGDWLETKLGWPDDFGFHCQGRGCAAVELWHSPALLHDGNYAIGLFLYLWSFPAVLFASFLLLVFLRLRKRKSSIKFQ